MRAETMRVTMRDTMRDTMRKKGEAVMPGGRGNA
jgi:hypothetical protein